MTKQSNAQSSSTKTGESQAYEEIVRLGEQLVNSLDPSGGRSPADPDLLSRWIAHEIASAMKAVDRAKSAVARNRAVQHATNLIMALWTHRSHWPTGWPPEPAQAMIDQVTRRNRRQATPEPTGSPWLDRFDELYELWREEGTLWWKLGLIELGVEPLREFAATEIANDDSFDLRRIKQDIELHDEAKSWLKSNDAGSEAKAKALIERRLRQIGEARRKLNREALEVSRPAPRRQRKKSK